MKEQDDVVREGEAPAELPSRQHGDSFSFPLTAMSRQFLDANNEDAL